MKSAHRVLDPAMPRTELNGVCALAVMTKAPRPGQVKTRLTPPLSPPEAAELNRCFLRDTTAAIAQASSNFAQWENIGQVRLTNGVENTATVTVPMGKQMNLIRARKN